MQSLFDLTGKVALITGSTRGIGYGIAERMAEAGAEVIISSENANDCDLVAQKLVANGFKATAIAADMSDKSQVLQLTEQALASFQTVDILVCNAGIAPHSGPLHTVSEEQWELTMNVNLRSAHWLSTALVPAMAKKGSGSVIFMSSLSAMRGNKAIGLYSLTKAALAQMARNLAVEWGPDNVRFNAIAPGLIDTDLAKVFHDNPDLCQRRLGLTPLRRMGHTDEIAGTAIFLASKAGAFVTGQTLVVDGGTLITDGN